MSLGSGPAVAIVCAYRKPYWLLLVTYWLLIGYLLEAPHQRLFPVNQSPNQCCRTSLRSYERVPYVRVPVQPVLVGTNATRDRASGVVE